MCEKCYIEILAMKNISTEVRDLNRWKRTNEMEGSSKEIIPARV